MGCLELRSAPRGARRSVYDPRKDEASAELADGALLVITGLLAGLGFIYGTELLESRGIIDHRFAILLERLGDALLVAALVTALLHVAEFKAFFKEFAGDVMLEKAFLRDLRADVLWSLRAKVSEVLVEKNVTNPEYLWQDLHRHAEKLLLNCLPTDEDAETCIYRRNYVEDVVVEYMTLGSALAQLREDLEGVSEAVKATPVIRLEKVIRFELVAPRADEPSTIEAPYEVTVDCCPPMPA